MGDDWDFLGKPAFFSLFFAFPINFESQSCINTSVACSTRIWAMGGDTRDAATSIGIILPFHPFAGSRNLAAIFFN